MKQKKQQKKQSVELCFFLKLWLCASTISRRSEWRGKPGNCQEYTPLIILKTIYHTWNGDFPFARRRRPFPAVLRRPLAAVLLRLAFLQLGHVRQHPGIGGQEVLGGFQGLGFSFAGGEELRRAFAHLDLQVDLLLDVIILEREWDMKKRGKNVY